MAKHKYDDYYKSEGIFAYLWTDAHGDDCATLVRPIAYVGPGDVMRTIPMGFCSDGASIPRLFWRVIGHPFSTRYLRGAVMHDDMYRAQYCTRKEADRYFYAYLKTRNIPVRAWLIYAALRIFGWIAWRHNAVRLENKRKKKGKK